MSTHQESDWWEQIVEGKGEDEATGHAATFRLDPNSYHLKFALAMREYFEARRSKQAVTTEAKDGWPTAWGDWDGVLPPNLYNGPATPCPEVMETDGLDDHQAYKLAGLHRIQSAPGGELAERVDQQRAERTTAFMLYLIENGRYDLL